MTTEVQPPEADLSYSIRDFTPGTHRDSLYLFDAIERVMVGLAAEVPRGRVLDVACGTGRLLMLIGERGCYPVGAEASAEMIGVGRWVQPESNARMVRSVAEVLPFADGAFDRVLCQGSLDHFADPPAFMREAGRIIKPDGRVIIGLANFESLSCRLGRLLDGAKRRLGRPRPPWRRYWQIPEDHNVKGDLPYVRSLGGSELELDRLFGMSMLWLLSGYGEMLDRLPGGAADRIVRGLDRLARRRPQHADMIISVWRKPGAAPWRARA